MVLPSITSSLNVLCFTGAGPWVPGLAGGEVQPGPVVGGAAGRTLAAQDAPRQGAIPGDDHHLRLDPNVGEGAAETWKT